MELNPAACKAAQVTANNRTEQEDNRKKVAACLATRWFVVIVAFPEGDYPG
jgi:hypothetical protein